MAFDKAMGMMGGKGKLAPKKESKPRPEPEAGKVEGEAGDGAGDSQTSITHNSDGSHTMDGETHPDHLHLMAALGHKLTGDKHHVAHHDGMAIHTHGVDEGGQHTETEVHNSAEEAKDALGRFFDEEAGEPQHQESPQQEESLSGY